MIIKFCFSVVSLLMLCQKVKQDRIVVIGLAQNAKAGAIVISKKDNKIYYLEGIAAWDEKIYDKQVKVSGALKTENLKGTKPGQPTRQEMVGIKRTIIKPRWELVK